MHKSASRWAGMRRVVIFCVVVLALAAAFLLGRSSTNRFTAIPNGRHVADAQAQEDIARQPVGHSQSSAPPRVSAGPAAPKDASDAALEDVCQREMRELLRTVRARYDPGHSAEDAFVHRALSVLIDPRASHVSLLQQAVTRWPDDAPLAWAYAQSCHANRQCDEGAAVRHLLRVDPNNVAAWGLAMHKAKLRKDSAAFAHALRQAALANGYDSHFGLVYVSLREALQDEVEPPSCATETEDMFVGSEQTPSPTDWVELLSFSAQIAQLPALQGWQGCLASQANTLSPAMQEQCRAALEQVASADTLIERLVAVNFLKKNGAG